MTASDRARSAAGPVTHRVTTAIRRQVRRPRSVRLTFAFDESGLRLIDRTPRMKPAAPSDSITTEIPADAILLELQSQNDEVLYRKRLRDPIPQDVEVFDPDGGPERVAQPPRRGSFSVTVPTDRRARQVVIQAGAAVRIAQLPIEREEGAPFALGRFSFRGRD